jgi:hypothetical protein
LKNHSRQLFLFGWKHGPQIEQHSVIFDSRDHWRVAQTALSFHFDDICALDGNQPAS